MQNKGIRSTAYEIQSLKRFTFPLERWVNGKCNPSLRWAHAKQKLVNTYEQWSMKEHRAQTERWTICERFVNTRWTIYSELSLHYIFLLVQKNINYTCSAVIVEGDNTILFYPISCKLYSYILSYLIPYYLCLGKPVK